MANPDITVSAAALGCWSVAGIVGGSTSLRGALTEFRFTESAKKTRIDVT
jgi:hypothetical protein